MHAHVVLIISHFDKLIYNMQFHCTFYITDAINFNEYLMEQKEIHIFMNTKLKMTLRNTLAALIWVVTMDLGTIVLE